MLCYITSVSFIDGGEWRTPVTYIVSIVYGAIIFFLLFRLFLDKRSRKANEKLRIENLVTGKIEYTRHKLKKSEARKK